LNPPKEFNNNAMDGRMDKEMHRGGGNQRGRGGKFNQNPNPRQYPVPYAQG
jgi:hypothetical protein